MTASYWVGEATALVADGSVLLVAAPPQDLALERLWPMVAGAAPVQAVLGELAAGGLAALPDFGLASWSALGDTVTVVLRGCVVAALHDQDTVQVDAHGIITWSESSFTRPQALSLMLPTGPHRHPLPLLGGVVPAGGVRCQLRRPDAGGSVPTTAPTSDSAGRPPGPPAEQVADLAARRVVDAPTTRASARLPGPGEDGLAAGASAWVGDAAGELQTPATESPSAGEWPRHAAADPRPTDVSDTGVDVVASPEPPVPAGDGQPQAPPAARPVAASIEDTLAPPADTLGGLIDGLPAALRTATMLRGDHVGDTVHRDVVESLRAGYRPMAVPLGAPQIMVAHCPDGHPNPPHATSCRVCAQPVPDQQPQPRPRPVVGVLRFESGAVVALERGLVIGRNPRVDGEAGGEVPQLVPVPSPEQNISRSHLRLDLHGWDVVVTDLGSQNGSEITVPGRPPQRLHADQPVTIPAGTRVGLAGEVFFTYEVQR